MKLLKKYMGYIVLSGAEILSYFYLKPTNLEMFFMIWGFLFLALLIYNVFNVFTDSSITSAMSGFGVSGGKLAFGIKQAESLYAENKNDKREGGGFLDPSNIIFLFLTIVNVVGYVVIMPK